MLMINAGSDLKLVEWLTSNPVGEVYSIATPVMGLEFETTRVTRRGNVVSERSGFRRWPIVPEPR